MRVWDQDDVRQQLRALSRRAGGPRRLAGEMGCSVEYVVDVLKGRRKPGPKILRPLRLEKVVTVTYREASNP